jgi:hypothetical protein
MGFADRLIYSTPAGEQPLEVPREKLDGVSCPECGGEIARYPVAHYTGPRIVDRCQACFHVLELRRPLPEDNWPPFRPATTDWAASAAERASVQPRRPD